MKKYLSTLTLLAVVSGCGVDPATQSRIEELSEKVEALEKKVEAQAMRGPGNRAKPPVDQEKEKAAAQLLKDANTAYTNMEFDVARAKLEELQKSFPDTRAARAGKRIEDELKVIGKDAGSLSVEHWYQGETTMDDGKATLLIFWEVWCPHCKREVPKVEAIYQKWKDKGLNIVGLTKQTRDISQEQVESFIEENKITYPIAKEAGQDVSSRFAVKGIPAAAVVKDGKIVWRGHPARINDTLIEKWLK